MSFIPELTRGELFGILTLLILGAGFVGMFTGLEYFFVIWILGFAVVLPILAMLYSEEDADREQTTDDQSTESVSDPLTDLRDQYVHGNLTDEEFEHKLDRLLETESPENAAEWRELATESVK